MPRPPPQRLRVILWMALVGPLAGQPLTRVPAASLRFSATPPASSYSTVPAFPPLSFAQPIAAVAPPGETRRLFVVEKTGRIWVIPDLTAATPARTLFLDLSTRIEGSSNPNDERGLLALAFHPAYASNGQFFVWYTLSTTHDGRVGSHQRLARFRVSSGDPNVADATSEQPLITQYDEAGNHNGGQLLFGPDGYLYLSNGDEGGGNDQFQNSQRIDRDFFSGVLRLDVDRRGGSLPPNPHSAVHTGTYTVPPDNPFVGATTFNGAPVSPGSVRTEFWAVGLRNPWRMAFDPATGQLWCGDVGQGTREEIDVIVRGGNYGWNYREGTIAGPRAAPPAGASFIAPIWDYPNPAQGSAVTGGLVYRGTRYAGLLGRYLFADFASGRIWALQPDGEKPVAASAVQQLATNAGISSFAIDPSNGDILLCDLLAGVIKRLVATPVTNPIPLPSTLSATGAFADLVTLAPASGVVPYEPNVSFWSDHAVKRRWFALPEATGTFGFARDGAWTLPPGAIWVKHFDLELTRGNPATARRIETRFLVKTATGSYGVTYRWNEAQTDAVLVPDEGADQSLTVTENGVARNQSLHFPSRAECLACHTPAGGHALTFNTRQLNRDHAFPGGTGNIIAVLGRAGYLDTPAAPAPETWPALAASDDVRAPLEHRARSYLDVNCAPCHQPGGPALGAWDARASIPLSLAGIVNGPLVDNGGDATNRVVVPADPAHSRLLQRMALRGPGQMPPLSTNVRDLAGENLLAQWTAALGEPEAPGANSRLLNLAARAQVSGEGGALIAGFVIAPGASKTVLLRGVGPGLAAPPFNLPGALADPALTLFGPDSPTRIAATNDNWNPSDAPLFAATGAFTLAAGSRDAAIVTKLTPGAYTAQLSGSGTSATAAGIALVEIYDADNPAAAGTATARLVNTAVRAHVGAGANVLIPGLVIGGGIQKTVLVRAVGPGLAGAPFNVAGTLDAPVLALYHGAQSIAANTRWNSAANAADVRNAARTVGAFPLVEGGADSALFITLPPGAYTLQVSGANGTTGVALVEVYEVR